MKKYSKKNGFFKYYNKDGLKARIKFENIADSYNGEIMVRYKHHDETSFLYHVPKKIFNGKEDIINFIMKNLVNNDLVFIVSPIGRHEGY